MANGEPNTNQAPETARVLKFERRRRGSPPRALGPANAAPDRKRKIDPADEPAQQLPRQVPRQHLPQRLAGDASLSGTHDDLHDDLARYEDEDAHIDYRQRMLMNVIALTIVAVLVGAGVWIADTIAAMQKAQDCAMQGRQNCAPIEVPLKH